MTLGMGRSTVLVCKRVRKVTWKLRFLRMRRELLPAEVGGGLPGGWMVRNWRGIAGFIRSTRMALRFMKCRRGRTRFEINAEVAQGTAMAAMVDSENKDKARDCAGQAGRSSAVPVLGPA